MIECAQHYRSPPKVSKELAKRQAGQPRAVRAISWKAQNRLHTRFMRLAARRLQRNKALVAIAWEAVRFCLGVVAHATVLPDATGLFLSKWRPKAAAIFRWGTTVPQTPPLTRLRGFRSV